MELHCYWLSPIPSSQMNSDNENAYFLVSRRPWPTPDASTITSAWDNDSSRWRPICDSNLEKVMFVGGGRCMGGRRGGVIWPQQQSSVFIVQCDVA